MNSPSIGAIILEHDDDRFGLEKSALSVRFWPIAARRNAHLAGRQCKWITVKILENQKTPTAP
jgi:hypothetical protein